MGNLDEQATLQNGCKEIVEGDTDEALFASCPKSLAPNSRPTSMVMKRGRSLIPAHLIAEAMSSLKGLDLRWSGPITPTELQYVEQYVHSKYPQYYNGLIHQTTSNLSLDPPSPESTPDNRRKTFPSSSMNPIFSNMDQAQLLPSQLLQILTTKSSFVSIPEIQAQNRALRNCGLTDEQYSVLFISNHTTALSMVGESYPFFRGNCYLSILKEEVDSIRGFAISKESKMIAAPESWLDLRIKGSQLSQYIRKKCKYSPKGLFCYPVEVGGVRYSMHWVSEARRNAWHVLVDATAVDFSAERMNLALHRPDFVVCAVEDFGAGKEKITCLLVRKTLFE